MAVTEICGFEIDLQKKKIKKLHLRIRKDGSILLTAPLRATKKDIESFVSSETEWIQAHQQRILGIIEKNSHRYDNGSVIPVLGREMILNRIIDNKIVISLNENSLIISAPEDCCPEDIDKELNKLYRNLLKERLSVLIPKWEEITGLSCSEWQMRVMTTRWGTCNTRTKKIWFSVKLGEKSDELIEYVVVHELVHTMVPNHGPQFKTVLGTHIPDWQDRKKRLNSGSY